MAQVYVHKETLLRKIVGELEKELTQEMLLMAPVIASMTVTREPGGSKIVQAVSLEADVE